MATGDVISSLYTDNADTWFDLGMASVGDTIVAMAHHRSEAQTTVDPCSIGGVPIPTVAKIETEIGNSNARRATYVCAKIVTANDIAAWVASTSTRVDFDTTNIRLGEFVLIEGTFDLDSIQTGVDDSGAGQASTLSPGPLTPSGADALAVGTLTLRYGGETDIAFSDSFVEPQADHATGQAGANGLSANTAVRLISAATSTTVTWTNAEECTAVLAVFDQPSSGQTILLGRATETDVARSPVVVNPRTVALGRVAEADVARGLIVANPRTYQLGRAAETDTAWALTIRQGAVVVLGRATETDVARGLTVVNPRTYQLARAAETDAARALAVLTPRTIGLGRATEADVARAITVKAGVVVTPAERILAVAGENRILAVAAEDRTYPIAAENRTLTVTR